VFTHEKLKFIPPLFTKKNPVEDYLN